MRSATPESPVAQPRIVARPEHTVSRKDIEVEALKVLYRLYHAGYTAYLVGGGVRDLLLGKTPKDFDVVTNARPGEIRKMFRNSRIIGRRFRLVQVFFRGGHIVEVSTFRRRSEFEEVQESAPHKDITFGSPAEDAQRRDLTINGLFYNIADFSLVDYVGGLEDLKNGVIRVIGDPAMRYVRDPVRMLRVLRHGARTGFRIDPAAWNEILSKRQLIRLCPPARVRDELLKDFRSGAARPFFQMMLRSKLFYAIFPAWEPALGERGERRLLDLCGRLDLLVQDGLSLSDSLLWAVFLSAFLESQPRPQDRRDLREFIRDKAREALGGIEFPRQRQDDVSQMLALVEILTQFFNQNRPVPFRYTRLATYRDTWLLYQIREAPAGEFLERCQPDNIPEKIPAKPKEPKRRRFRRYRKGRRERTEERAKNSGGEG